MFLFLTAILATLMTLGFLVAYRRTADILNPTSFLILPMSYIYVVTPFLVYNTTEFRSISLSSDEWTFAQIVAIVFTGALLLGLQHGARKSPDRQIVPARKIGFTDAEGHRLRLLAYFFALVSLLFFSVTLGNVGGFEAAYSQVKGRGDAESGYVRDAVYLCVPAILLLAAVRSRKSSYAPNVKQVFRELADYVWIGPMLISGLLGSRRGPTFIAITAVSVSWYLSRGKRPSIPTFILGTAGMGVLLLAIMLFREEFNLSSGLFSSPAEKVSQMSSAFSDRLSDQNSRNITGSEFVFGASKIAAIEEVGGVFWGRRLLVQLFIRPIPSSIWPTKYEDVGMSSWRVNAGLGFDENSRFESTMGAAPGIVADVFAEFYWFGTVLMFAIGFFFSRTWYLAVFARSTYAFVTYGLIVSLSIFLTMQTFAAFLVPFLFCMIPTIALLQLCGIRRSSVLANR